MLARTTTFAALLAILSAPVAAQPTPTSSNYWTIGKLQRLNQGLTVHTNIPVDCRPRMTAAAATWTNSGTGWAYTYRYLVSAQSWSWDPYTYNSNTQQYGDNLSTTANTTDTSIESGRVDSANSLAQAERRGMLNSTGNRWIFTDGDVVFNYAIFGTTAWCGATPTPSNQSDVESIALHELGHVIGLEHDGEDYNRTYVMGAGVTQGVTRRSLTSRDITRASWLAKQ